MCLFSFSRNNYWWHNFHKAHEWWSQSPSKNLDSRSMCARIFFVPRMARCSDLVVWSYWPWTREHKVSPFSNFFCGIQNSQPYWQYFLSKNQNLIMITNLVLFKNYFQLNINAGMPQKWLIFKPSPLDSILYFYEVCVFRRLISTSVRKCQQINLISWFTLRPQNLIFISFEIWKQWHAYQLPKRHRNVLSKI